MDVKQVNWWKVALIALIGIGLLVGGIFIGRKTVKPIPQQPIYIKGDSVKVEVPVPVPVEVVKPCDTTDVIKKCIKSGKYAELFPEKVITKDSLVYIPTSEDTLAIVRDWATERTYKEKVFDSDTLGSATVDFKVQYNRVSEFSATVVPVTKVQPYVKAERKFEPFAAGGITTQPTVTVQAGAFIHQHWGAAVMYQRDWELDKNYVGLSIFVKY